MKRPKIFADGDVVIKRFLRRYIYQLYQTFLVGGNEFIFTDYEQLYSYRFYVCYTEKGIKVQTELEVPYGADPDYLLSNVSQDFATMSSNNIQFDLYTKKLTIKNWEKKPIKIDKVMIYRKQWEIL